MDALTNAHSSFGTYPLLITRAIFVLTCSDAAEQFLRVMPDLRAMGLEEATLLHLVSAQPGPAEPMPELANWVRHYEAAVPRVELALKRGDAVKWIYELARVRNVDLVVISGIPNGTDWDFERVSSPLRNLGIPILYLPDEQLSDPITQRVLLGIKALDTFEPTVEALLGWLPDAQLSAICVSRDEVGPKSCRGVELEIVQPTGDVATTLLDQVDRQRATLVAILAEEDEGKDAPRGRRGTPVVKPLLEMTRRPVLIWPPHGRVRRRSSR